MIIVKNKFIPFGKYDAMNVFGIIFARKELTKALANHEAIHTAQMKELLYVGFYVWYVLEWIIKLVKYRNNFKAYRAISFEREAYSSQENLSYLEGRKHYVWLRFLRLKN